MAVSVGSQGSGRRRSLDAEINLVPFIDLLSMCICFLLMTAVWVEIGTIEMKQILGTEAAPTTNLSVDLELRFKADQSLEVVIQKAGQTVQTLPIQGAELKDRLAQLTTTVSNVVSALGSNPQQQYSLSARVLPAKQVPYSDMIAVFDVLRSYGISNLGVIPAKE